MDPITSSFSVLAQSGISPSATALTATAKVDSLAAARFSAIMGQPMPVAEAVQATSALPTSGAVTAAAPSNSIGDRILSGINQVSNNFQSAWNSLSASLGVNEQSISTQDLLKLQMQLLQVSVQYDLVGKTVSRSTQNIDQLVRLQ